MVSQFKTCVTCAFAARPCPRPELLGGKGCEEHMTEREADDCERFVCKMINELNAAGIGYRLKPGGELICFSDADKEKGEAIIARIENETAGTADQFGKEKAQ